MTGSRRRNTMLFATLVVLCGTAIPGCDFIDGVLFPCATPLNFDTNDDYVDGTWGLYSVNSAVFGGAYTLPDGAVLRSAQVSFHTLRLDKGSCDSPDESSGEVVAEYAVSKAGSIKPLKVVVGGFTYKRKAKSVTLRVLGYTAAGSVNFAAVFDFFDLKAKIPLGGDIIDLGTVTYNLSFRR